jgi:osmotically-inducible protein OsmY
MGMQGMQSYGGNRAATPYGAGQFGQRPGQMGGMYPGMQRFGAQGMSNAATMRTELTLGFDRPAGDSQKISSSVSTRLASLPALHWSTPGQVEVQGRTAILRGVVATAHDRDLAERVVRLEAGIDQVDNQLVVASNSAYSPAAAPEGPTADRSPPAADSSKEPAAANSPPAAQPAPK